MFTLFSVIVAYNVYCYIIITVVIVNVPFFCLYTYHGEGTGVISKKQILKHYKNIIFSGWLYFTNGMVLNFCTGSGIVSFQLFPHHKRYLYIIWVYKENQNPFMDVLLHSD